VSLPIKQQLEACIEKLRRNELTEQDLRQIMGAVDPPPRKCQDLLYLQANTTSVAARVLGMAMLENGKLSDGPANPEQWPYQTVLDALKDGWRVIQFPNLALLMDESRAYALGCEFILER
jgi:dihydroxyacid dehydratase/phosphogluconate dehydratase